MSPRRTALKPLGRLIGKSKGDAWQYGSGPDRFGFPDVSTPLMGRVWLTSSDGGALHATLLGPAVERAYDAGWEEIERRRRRNALDFKGRALKGWDLTLLLDAFRERARGGDVERECSDLEEMAEPVRRGGVPPTVRVAGVAPIAKADWVIVSREPAEQDFWIWRHRRRVRAIYTVSIVEAAFPNLVKITPAKRTRDRQGDPVPRFYTVKRSDRHLRGIAQRVLGDGDRWREIARKNKIRDGKNIKAGQRLRLP